MPATRKHDSEGLPALRRFRGAGGAVTERVPRKPPAVQSLPLTRVHAGGLGKLRVSEKCGGILGSA
jgi:hypothetical protein